MNLFLILLFCFINKSFAQDKECQIPVGATGANCQLITSCPEILKRIKEIKQADDYQEIMRLQCGWAGTSPKICCPVRGAAAASPPKPAPATPSSILSSSSFDEVSPLLPKPDSCGIIGDFDRIVGGMTASIGQFPWMTLVEYKKGDKGSGFYCGAVLISERYALSAAHCFVGKDIPKTWKAVRVRLGELNTATEKDCMQDSNQEEECADPPVDVAISEIITHEDYDPSSRNQYNDIALLRLYRAVPFSDYIKPICLPPPPKTKVAVSTYVAAGWGRTESRSESADLLFVNINDVEAAKCQSTYKRLNVTLGPSQICAGGQKGKDSCRGDSGGPLMALIRGQGGINYYSLGIVSFGPTPCGTQGWPGVYTRVQDYIPWIYSKLKP